MVLACVGELASFDDWFGPSFAALHADDIESFMQARTHALRQLWPWLAENDVPSEP